MRKALFIPDDAGFGHRVRCEALAVELERRGWGTRTIAPDDEIPGDAFEVCVVDLRGFMPRLPEIPKSVRIIDDPAAAAPCNLLVFGSAGANNGVLLSGSADNVLAGPQYSLLRQEFEEERRIRRTRSGVLDVRKIAGWSARSLAEQMGCAQVVISYAGMRAMEAACVTTPSVLVARNHGETLSARGLLTAGAAIEAGEDDALAVAENVKVIPSLLERMSQNARVLVDGRGCERVAESIEELFR